MKARLVWTPCFDLAEMSDFEIGEPHLPLPDIERCVDNYFDLDYARGWHPVAGFGLVRTPQGDFVGRAVQDCRRFEPERIRVVQRVCSDGRVRKVIYTSSGGVKPGRATMTHDYAAPLEWRPGLQIKQVVGFMPSSESTVPVRLNPEVRGKLAFKPNAEGGLVLSAVISESARKFIWWCDGKDGDLISQTQRVEIARPLRKDIWHRLVMLLTATDVENTWLAKVSLFEDGVRVLKNLLPTYFLINGVSRVHNLFAGDEIERDLAGGVVYYERLAAMWRLQA